MKTCLLLTLLALTGTLTVQAQSDKPGSSSSYTMFIGNERIELAGSVLSLALSGVQEGMVEIRAMLDEKKLEDLFAKMGDEILIQSPLAAAAGGENAEVFTKTTETVNMYSEESGAAAEMTITTDKTGVTLQVRQSEQGGSNTVEVLVHLAPSGPIVKTHRPNGN